MKKPTSRSGSKKSAKKSPSKGNIKKRGALIRAPAKRQKTGQTPEFPFTDNSGGNGKPLPPVPDDDEEDPGPRFR